MSLLFEPYYSVGHTTVVDHSDTDCTAGGSLQDTPATLTSESDSFPASLDIIQCEHTISLASLPKHRTAPKILNFGLPKRKLARVMGSVFMIIENK